MAAQDPELRSLISAAASRRRWGLTVDRKAATAPARSGLRARFEREVRAADRDRVLTPAEIEDRIDQLHRAHMLTMSIKAREARRKAREATKIAEDAERELAEMDGAA